MPPHQYARIEHERRFLLAHFPAAPTPLQTRQITDHYLTGTTLRLREQHEPSAAPIFKLTQKLPAPGPASQQGFITTIYLTESEFRLLSQLPANTLRKIRHSLPPFGIDQFQGTLEGLILAEAEFDSPAAAESLLLPPWISHEVTTDARFTGGSLVQASRRDIQAWALEYGITIAQS